MTAEWLDDALCRDYPPEWWFPHEKNQHADWETPRAICNACPVQTECAAYAAEMPCDYGMYGGLTPEQRRSDRRSPRPGTLDRLVGLPPRRAVAECGTEPGYRAHLRRHEKACDPCRAAAAALNRANRLARLGRQEAI